VITSDIRAIIEPGAAIVVGVADADGWPRATRGWSVTPLDGDQRLRVVVSADDDVLLGRLAPPQWVAVTASDVKSLKAVQFKGRVETAAGPMTSDDALDFERGCEMFLAKVRRTDGNAVEKMRRMLPTEAAVFEMTLEQAYDQSPGPAAGRPWSASR